jgi:hypothetical protein
MNLVSLAFIMLSEKLKLPKIKYDGRWKSSWTGGSAPLVCSYASLCITAAHYRQSTNFSKGPRSSSAILKRALLKRS